MKFSFLIPFHDYDETINYLLNNIENQVLVNNQVEIICVLDNCKRNIKQTIWKKKIKFLFSKKITYKIKIVNNNNLGKTRNDGFDLITGDYVWFVDSDDWLLTPYAVQDMVNFLKFTVGDKKIGVLNFSFLQKEILKQYNDNNGKMFCNVWCRIFNTEIIKNIRFKEINYAEDLDFVNKVFEQCKLEKYYIAIMHTPFYFYNHPRTGSLTS